MKYEVLDREKTNAHHMAFTECGAIMLDREMEMENGLRHEVDWKSRNDWEMD